MKVLLLNPPYFSGFIRSARCTIASISGSNWYPIFLAYATGWLEKHGHQVKLIDGVVGNYSIKEVVSLAFDFKPELLVLYISSQSLENDIFVGEQIKKKTGAEIVLVGPWCSFEPEKILKKYKNISCIARREFDNVVLDLANGKKKRDIPGLIYREGEKIKSNGEREFLTPAQLDQFPFVTKIYKEHLPIKNYYQASLLYPYVDLFTGRGCAWGKCTFCLWPFTIHKDAPKYRTRSIGNVFEELLYIKKELPGVREVFFQDDMLPAGRARQIAELILKNNLKMNWSCYVKADMDLETLRMMKKSGCRYLHVGYETIDPAIIKNIQKGTKASTMKEFTEKTKKAGLRVHGDFILGLPGETKKTIETTIKWAKDLGIEGYQIFIPQPHKATPLYKYLKSKGYLTRNGDISYPHLSQKELIKMRYWALRQIYFSRRYILRTIKNINSLKEALRLLRTAFYVFPNIIKHQDRT